MTVTLTLTAGVAVLGIFIEQACASEQPTTSAELSPPASDGYVGPEACGNCHVKEYEAWRASSHAGAMRTVATTTETQSLNGEARFGKNGGHSINFIKSDARTEAKIATPDGSSTTKEVAFVLGQKFLEQPVVRDDRGRLQALPVARDAGTRDWFDIFSGEERVPGDYGHWTGLGMNANSQCVECHSTGYLKAYDHSTRSYSSKWADMGVTCEACHGAGADHGRAPNAAYGPFGRTAGLSEFRPSASPAAGPEPIPPATEAMSSLCATCHSIRRVIADGFAPGAEFLDFYEPSLIDDDIYWSDGSVRHEAFEWGSYLQSRMHAAGVNCLACHEIHGGGLRAEGNALCLSCHEAKYSGREHTAHNAGSTGAQCVSCHMPEHVFMARDKRRDHALTIPDPILAKEVGVPSACEPCHARTDRSSLADSAIRMWPRLGEERHVRRRRIAAAFRDAREGKEESVETILQCVSGQLCDVAIVRATAARLTVRLPFTESMETALLDAVSSHEPLLRTAATAALADVDARQPAIRRHLMIALADPVKAVRTNAAWALRAIQLDQLPRGEAIVLRGAYDEWRASTMLLSEAPESWHTPGPGR